MGVPPASWTSPLTVVLIASIIAGGFLMHYDSGIEGQVSRGSAAQKPRGDEEQNKNSTLFVEQNTVRRTEHEQ